MGRGEAGSEIGAGVGKARQQNVSFRALTAVGLPMMSRKMTQARPNGFVEYKGHTRHLSAERSEESRLVCRVGFLASPGMTCWVISLSYIIERRTDSLGKTRRKG